MHPLIKSIFELIKETQRKLGLVADLAGSEQLSDINKNLTDDLVADQILNLMRYLECYWCKKDYLQALSLRTRAQELESRNGVFATFEQAVQPDGVFFNSLKYLLDKRAKSDTLSFTITKILQFSYLTYVDQMLFMHEQFALIAEFYFEQTDVSMFNDYLVTLMESCISFQKQHSNLAKKIRTVLTEIELVTANSGQKEFIIKLGNALEIHDEVVREINLAFVLDEPQMIQRKPDFSKSSLKMPFGHWETNATVSYAIQNEVNGVYSKIGAWSAPYNISQIANPIVHLGPCKQNRLVFRKLGSNNPPKLVAILKADGPTSFHDIDRDLFDTASNFNENDAIQHFEILLQHGANVGATFDDGASILHAAAAAGNVNLARDFLLTKNLIDVNLRDDNGYTALHIAAKIGYEDFVKTLIEHKADVNCKTKNGLTPLQLATLNNHLNVIEHLLKCDTIDLSTKDQNGLSPFHSAVFGGPSVVEAFSVCNTIDFNAKSTAGCTALQLAVLTNDLEVTSILLELQKIDISFKSDNGNFTALHFAVMCRNLKMVQLLLKQQQLNVNATAINDITALHLSISMKAENIALELLEAKDIDVNAKTRAGSTPLHIAAQTDSHAIAAKILEHPVEVDARTNLGFTALHLAAKFGASRTLATLIQHKADITLKTNEGLTGLMLAATGTIRNSSVLKQLLEDVTALDEAFRSDVDTFAWLTAQNASLEVFKYFVENFKGIRFEDKIGNNFLHHAVNGENFAVIEYLVTQKSFDVNSKNRRGQSALHFAVKSGSLKTIQYLLELGADLEIEDECEHTPIFYALDPERFQILTVLLEKEANATHSDKRQANILHYAALKGNLQLVKYLVEEKHMCPKERDHAGENALFYAARKNRLQIAKYLVDECGINIRHRCHRNRTPLIAAISHNSLNVVRYLTEERGADVNARDKDKITALHFACQYNFSDMVKYLLARGANIHAKDFCDKTPILYAAEYADVEILKYLIEHGSNIYDKNNYEISSLHYAALGGNLPNVKYLVEVQNMDALVKDRLGEIPIFYAARLDNLSVIKYFIEDRKISPYVRTNNNRTLLHSAYYLDIVKYLVEEHDLDINAIDKHYMTPLDAADKETAIYLKSLGAF